MNPEYSAVEPENRHLEDFFRKKLSEPSPEGDGWDRPDPAVWQKAQTRLAPTPTAAPVFTVWHAVAAVGLVLLIMNIGFTQWMHQQEIQHLQTELLAKEARILSLEKTAVQVPSVPPPAADDHTQEQLAVLETRLQKVQAELLYMRKKVAREDEAKSFAVPALSPATPPVSVSNALTQAKKLIPVSPKPYDWKQPIAATAQKVSQ
ncbi:MAG: hypothetical protein AAFV07_18760, partial [Bacteroidota bacterium]